jgi:cell surface protein SprA
MQMANDDSLFRGAITIRAIGILGDIKIQRPGGNSTQGSESYSTTASTKPDIEDVNSDFTMNENERYFQYRISLRPEDMVLGKNFIADVKEGKAVDDGKGGTKQVKWYQFKVPVKSPEKTVGAISDLKSIRFLRMFLRGFNEQTVLRMATFDLVRADWRKYSSAVDENVLVDDSDTQFEISAVISRRTEAVTVTNVASGSGYARPSQMWH